MVHRYRYLHLDVFTNRLFGGNQLAVFPNAVGMTTEQMQAVTREINFSESTFILPRERDDTDVRMRIFTPGAEMPMAGHPTVGSTFALALEGIIPAGRRRWVFGLNIGPTPVDIDWDGVRPTFAWMTQRRPEFGHTLPDVDGVAHALGLDPVHIRVTGLPVQDASCGVPFIFVPLSTRAAVDAAVLNRSAFAQLAADVCLTDERAVFVFSTEPGPDAATVYSRMFAPGLGVVEDPATGAASGPLGCYLVHHRVVPADRADRILSLQGARMGRPSWIHIAIATDGADIVDVRVGGEAVLVATGEFSVEAGG
ncbi:MAG: PhzF family phenazine biosynthesis protein [Vicinamibacterales bacterium]|nr:PhzF family phenazine biosynthesis protein [Vicinamibacterales bacterium]